MDATSDITTSGSQVIRLYGAVPDSIVDGPGLRYAVFVQGCSHDCPGCHNPESHDPAGGEPTTVDAVYDDIRANGLVHDVTFSGGDPFEQAAVCALLARRLKDDGYGVWAYTGYLYEDLERVAAGAGEGGSGEGGSHLDAQGVRDLLACVDVLVDGPFVKALKSLGLKWRGSSNQRLVDVAASRAAGRVVEWTGEAFSYEKPASW